MSEFRCKVRADLFARVALAMSTEETRYYLMGVRIEPHPAGGAYLVATNGHIMLVAYDDTAEVSGEAIVSLPAPLLKACGAKPRRGADAPTLEIRDGRAMVSGLSADDVLIGASYPDWRFIIPREVIADVGAGDCAFNGQYLAVLGKALNPDARYTANVRLFPQPHNGAPDKGAAHLARGDAPDMFGVIMPVRWNGADVGKIPAWFVSRFAEQAAA